MKQRKLWIPMISLLGGLIGLFAAPAQALPVLAGEKFFAPSSLFNASGWSYTGTLPSTFNAGFKAKNIDDDFFGDSGVQYSTGQRSMTSTAGSTPSYTLALRGEFQARTSEAWETTLLAQSQKIRQSDIDKMEFPAPGGSITNEHPIPSSWSGISGYASPAGNFAQFNQKFTLSKNYLEPGQFGCPLVVSPGGPKTGHCAFTEAYFKGGANLQANLQGYGSIENVVAGAQSVSIEAKANRITTFKVNNDPIYSGQISGTAANFNLEEEKVKSVDFSFKGNFKEKSIAVGANVQWDGQGNTSTFDASYVQRVEMTDYVNVGRFSEYLVQVRDDPQLTAGIGGTDFYRASVLASTSVSAIDAFLAPVFEPLASSRLVVNKGVITNLESPNLKIPSGGFQNDLPLYLHFLLSNEGSIDLTVDGIDFNFFDRDFFFSDQLGALHKSLNTVIYPNSQAALDFFLLIPQSALNRAVDLFEGDYLELAGLGTFRFHDDYGTRERDFAVTIPEPESIALILIGLVALGLGRRPRKYIPSAAAS